MLKILFQLQMLYIWRTAEIYHVFPENNMRDEFLLLDCVNFDMVKMQERLDKSYFKII